MSNVNDHNKKIIAEFRANGGKVGGHFAGKTLLLLHHVGAKSGEARINPLACVQDGDRYVIIASKGGAPTHPDWYFNLVANPNVTIEVGAETLHVRASVAEEPERTRLYDKMVSVMPGFEEYRRKAARVIPVFILTPVK